MGYIKIEARPVLPGDPLGFEGSHLYFHYAVDFANPGTDSLIRAGPTGTAGNWGSIAGFVDVPINATPDAYPANDPTGSTRPFAYLNIGFQDSDAYWANMGAMAVGMLAQGYSYNPFPAVQLGGFSEANAGKYFAHNSNSFITSMLYHLGFDPAATLPTGLTGTEGFYTLLDIPGAHTLSAVGFFKDIMAGDGNDTVTGDGEQNFLFGGSGIDNINGADGNDVLLGEANGDVLTGGNGDDWLFGGTGIDTLRGGSGFDVLTGGSANDTFDFNAIADSTATTAGADQIVDFLQGTDKIDLSTIDADSGASGNQAFVFIGTDAFTAPGQLRYTAGLTATVVQINVTGTGGPEMTIIVKPAGLVLTAADFIL